MKATSPYLNMLIVVGVIIIYIDTILFGIDGRVASDDVLKITCNVSDASGCSVCVLSVIAS